MFINVPQIKNDNRIIHTHPKGVLDVGCLSLLYVLKGRENLRIIKKSEYK